MKFLVPVALAGLAIWLFGSHAKSAVQDATAESPALTAVGDLMKKAASGEPLDGRPAPSTRWVRRMTAACVERERRLTSVPRVTSPPGVARRGRRILAIHRAYARRIASIRAPSAWRPEVLSIQGFNLEQQLILRRVVAAARTGNLGNAMQEAVALRELSGRANAVFLRLGIDRCAFGASGMPL